jgi:hypothetical protein
MAGLRSIEDPRSGATASVAKFPTVGFSLGPEKCAFALSDRYRRKCRELVSTPQLPYRNSIRKKSSHFCPFLSIGRANDLPCYTPRKRTHSRSPQLALAVHRAPQSMFILVVRGSFKIQRRANSLLTSTEAGPQFCTQRKAAPTTARALRRSVSRPSRYSASLRRHQTSTRRA